MIKSILMHGLYVPKDLFSIFTVSQVF